MHQAVTALAVADAVHHQSWSAWVVPLGVGTIATIGALLLIGPGRMMAPYCIVALTVTGTSGLMSGSIGPLVHDGVTKLNGFVGQWATPYTGVAITLIISVIAMGCLGFWLYHRQFDLRTFGFAALLPVATTFIPGPLGDFLTGVVGLVPAIVTGLIRAGFGLGG